MNKAVGLPWPRGAPPKFDSSSIKKNAAHWNVRVQMRCAQCGSLSNCEHKDRHAKDVNREWEDMSEDKDNRPNFFREPARFQSQIKGQPQLGIDEPLPVGMRRGWEAYPGNEDVRIDSPRRHGEWRLVFVPRDKSKDHMAVDMEDPPKRSRSTNPVAHKQREARKKWDEERVNVALDRDALRSVSMTPGVCRRPGAWGVAALPCRAAREPSSASHAASTCLIGSSLALRSRSQATPRALQRHYRPALLVGATARLLCFGTDEEDRPGVQASPLHAGSCALAESIEHQYQPASDPGCTQGQPRRRTMGCVPAPMFLSAPCFRQAACLPVGEMCTNARPPVQICYNQAMRSCNVATLQRRAFHL